MIKVKIIITLITFFLTVNAVFANSKLPIPVDNRMRTLVYSPNEVFRLKFKVGYQSHIVFGKEETPILQSFGDSRGWSVKLVGNSLFIKPLDPGLQTNMIVETNKDRIYYFEVLSTFAEDEKDDDFAYRVNFFYPDILVDIPQTSNNKGSLSGSLKLPDGKRVPGDLAGKNYLYSFAGSGRDIKPVKVFDDGVSTYMLFMNLNEKIPMIYAVDKDGKEYLMQYRIKDGYVVIDSTEYQFALRLGSELVCIFNDKYVPKRKKILGIF